MAGKDDPPSGRPHVWSFWAAILVAAIGAATTIVVGIQKGHSEDKRQDLEARIQTLEADHTRDQNRIASLSAELAAARRERGQPGSGAVPKSSGLPPATPARAEPSADPRVQAIENYVFTLDACRRQSTDIYCWIVVRNDAPDRELRISSESRLIADDGTPYLQSSRIFGDREAAFENNLYMHVPSGVPTRFGLRFKGLALKLPHLSLVEVVAQGFRVQFRDVNVI
ncbi:MAG TPA: hypothetical protein VHQ90_10930 [Thermoanaerobaculia bacterium]|nr:hypothetical protein [Thermoanaerobaculia bacterium]